MSNGRHLFKVDITQISIDRSSEYLALLNFNIPADVDLEACLRDVQSFIDRHFAPPQPRFTYQVTASYRLRRPDTGEDRVWTGSFVAGSDQCCSLSGNSFTVYDAATFRDVVRRSVSDENVVGCLSWKESDTAWQFDGVETFILSFQAKLNVSLPFFLRFRILPAGRGSQTRRHHTVVEPR